ncbi:SAGA complex subunit spt3 [Penicillium longicatenatum]|uniref:SAGA complex subunit spt3 n=1 Tax=Penicillium longicatenatum TaxID=1561947 RepID=UPI00254881CF|nr:SAGA complex subunit spt3 [Penicillium longicatenatum]KAJ5658761.1 SAGA complex subunit spt3 [Penicillium longicatenatum]
MAGNKADPRVAHISLEDIEIARSELPKQGPLSVSEDGHLWLARQQKWPSFEELLRDLEESDADGHVHDKLAKPITVEPQIEGMPCGADMYPGPCSEMNALFCKMRRKNFEISDGNEDQGMNNGPVSSTLPSSPDEEEENQEADAYSSHDDKSTITNMIFQMMFVSGETAEPSIDTTTLIEDITRQQVLEILSRSTQLATRRGSRSISTDDLIFLIRHDKAKVSRLRTFLSWKDVRKNVKDSDDKGGADAADFAAADDAAGVVAGPQDVAAKPKNKRAKVGLAWDVHSFFSVQIPERDDEEDEEEEEQNYATLQRLAAADERTKHMTREEYVFWSECRQASFTYRKSKRFREWAGFGIVTESKPNDDIVDILGFLTFEIVQTLTEEALKVKEREDHEKNRGGAETTGESAKKRKRETGLFDPPEEGRTPIEPRHIREAYRKLQATPQKAIAMLLHNGRVPARLPLRLI